MVTAKFQVHGLESNQLRLNKFKTHSSLRVVLLLDLCINLLKNIYIMYKNVDWFVSKTSILVLMCYP